MLSDWWRDVIGLLGFFLTGAGLFYAIIQIRKTKSAAQAAEEAASKVLQESRASFRRYAASIAHRFINEAKIYVDKGDWDKAAMRMNDLADQAAQLGAGDPEWQQTAESLRNWAAACRKPRFPKMKWTQFSVVLQGKIDAWHGPFQEHKR